VKKEKEISVFAKSSRAISPFLRTIERLYEATAGNLFVSDNG